MNRNSRPTIQELEEILASKGPHNITIAPDGSIHVGVNMGDITGIHLQGFKDRLVVSLEIGGEWVEVIKSGYDGIVSHIVEPAGVQQSFDAHCASKILAATQQRHT